MRWATAAGWRHPNAACSRERAGVRTTIARREIGSCGSEHVERNCSGGDRRRRPRGVACETDRTCFAIDRRDQNSRCRPQRADHVGSRTRSGSRVGRRCRLRPDARRRAMRCSDSRRLRRYPPRDPQSRSPGLVAFLHNHRLTARRLTGVRFDDPHAARALGLEIRQLELARVEQRARHAAIEQRALRIVDRAEVHVDLAAHERG